MSVTTLEDLPNELWLEIFIYFSWSELNAIWFQWKLNHRIEMLVEVAKNHVALSLSSKSFTRHSQCLHYFEHEHPLITSRITSLLLNESSVVSEIISRWRENDTSFLPRLRQCTVYIDLINRIDRYDVVLKMFIKQRISLHSMQFIMIKGKISIL
jgi:hypothetical protein